MKNAGIMTFCYAIAVLSGTFCVSAWAQETKPEKTATTSPATAPATMPESRPDEPSLRQESLMAARAAAVEKLLGRVGKLKIGADGKNTLSDLMAEDVWMKTVVIAYLSSLETKGEPQYSGNRDKKCTVTLEASVKDLQEAMGDNFLAYRGKKFKDEDIQKLAKNNDKDAMSETAAGEADPKKWLPDGEAVTVGMDGYLHKSLLTGAAEKYWSAHCSDEGRLGALRVARKRAIDSLLTQVNDLDRVAVSKIVGDSWGDAGLTEELTSGARETTVLYYRNAPVVEVAVEMRLRGFYASLRSWAKTHDKDKDTIELLMRLALKAGDEKCTAVGIAAVDAESFKNIDKDKKAAVVIVAANAFKELDGHVSRSLIGENSRPLRVNAMALVALKISRAKIAFPQFDSSMTVGEYAASNAAFGRTLIEFLQLMKTTESKTEGDKPEINAEIDMVPLQRAFLNQVSKDRPAIMIR